MGSHNPAAQLAFMDGIHHFIPSPAPGQQFFAGLLGRGEGRTLRAEVSSKLFILKEIIFALRRAEHTWSFESSTWRTGWFC
jgi:hypothetical protein